MMDLDKSGTHVGVDERKIIFCLPDTAAMYAMKAHVRTPVRL